MLVSAVMPIMSIYRLPLGQYGYTGHIINLPQDVVTFTQSLPRLPSEVDVLIVRKDYQQSHKDFRVRSSVVQDALTYLIENNKYYRANAICLNQEAPQQLPEDGNLREQLRSLDIPEAEGQASTDQPEPSEDQYEEHLSTSFVPNATQQRTEQETVQQSLQDLQSGSTCTLIWTTMGGAPINEYTTEGYMSMAFPTLYPTGAANFLGVWSTQVTIGNAHRKYNRRCHGHFRNGCLDLIQIK